MKILPDPGDYENCPVGANQLTSQQLANMGATIAYHWNLFDFQPWD